MLATFLLTLVTFAAFLPAAHAHPSPVFAPHGLDTRQTPGYTAWGVVIKFPFKTYIDSWSFSVTVPPVPAPQLDQGFSGALLQTNGLQYAALLTSYSNPKKVGCNAKPGQWCVSASYFTLDAQQFNGTFAAVSPKDVLTYSFKQETPTTGTIGPGYRVRITKNGQVISQIRGEDDGLGIGYVISSSCELNSQKVPAFSYKTMSFGLGLPYPNFFKDSPPQLYSTTNSQPTTNNNGLTWNIATVSSSAVQCNV